VQVTSTDGGGDVVTVTQTSFSTFIPTSSETTAPSSTSQTSSLSSTVTGTAAPQQVSSGLSKSGTIAIAVVVPIAVVALLAILAFFFWRRNRDKKARLAARKGEIEDYGFDPNAPDGAGLGPGPSTGTALGAAGVGTLAGGAAVGTSNEMRQTYGEDDGTGYRGWGPTSSNNKRPSWLPVGTTAAEAGMAGAVGAGAGAYYAHQRGNNGGAYETYPAQQNEDYYYPDGAVDRQGGAPPDIPPKSYDRYDPAFAGGYTRDDSEEHSEEGSRPLGVVNADVQRQLSNASSRYSTVSTDENAGRSYQNSPQTQPAAGFPSTGGAVGRPGRSTMGRGRADYEGADYDDQGAVGRYDAVNF
jgi:hypothetical protein